MDALAVHDALVPCASHAGTSTQLLRAIACNRDEPTQVHNKEMGLLYFERILHTL